MIENGKYGLKCEECALNDKPEWCDKSLEERFCAPQWSERQLKAMEKRRPDFKYNFVNTKINRLAETISQEPFDPEWKLRKNMEKTEVELIKEIQKILIVGLYTYRHDMYGAGKPKLEEAAMEEYWGFVGDGEVNKVEYNTLNVVVNTMTAKLMGLYEKTN